MSKKYMTLVDEQMLDGIIGLTEAWTRTHKRKFCMT